MATQLPVQVNGKRYVVLRNLYPVDGTAQDYFRFSHATVALLVEGPTNNPMPYSQRRTPAVVGTRGSWQHLMTRIIDGPSLVIHTRKQDGAPAEATVRIEEMPTKNEERWTTRPRDGRQRRLLSKPGSYTIVVEGVAGSARKTVVVGSRAVEVDLVLQP